MNAPTTKTVRCQDCHTEREIPVTETVPAGWHYLYVAARIRCPECAGALSRVNDPNRWVLPSDGSPIRIYDDSGSDFKIEQMDPPVEDSSPTED